MKNFKILLLVLVSMTILSCDRNRDDNTTPTPTQSSTNGITINGTFKQADHVYVAFDEKSPYHDGFWIVMSDGEVVNDTGHTILVSTNATVAAGLLYYNASSAHNLTSPQQVDFNVKNYILDKDDSVVGDNVSNFTNLIYKNGKTYGQIEFANPYIIENTGSATLDITSLTKDFTNKNGTIDFTFTMVDDNGVVITGQYSGTYDMLHGDA